MDESSIERGAKVLDAANAAESKPLSDKDAQRLLELVATWPPLKYLREREAIARQLGVPLGQLDKLVRSSRVLEVSGTALPFDEVEPCGDPVNGADLLAELVTIIRSYVVLDATQATLCALWIVLGTRATLRL